MFDIEVLDSWTDMDEREIKVGDTVRHMRAPEYSQGLSNTTEETEE